MSRKTIGFFTDDQGRKRPITAKTKKGYSAKVKKIIKKKGLKTLTLVEQRGSTIRHKTVGTEGKIVGSYYGGFVVEVEGERLGLPFDKIRDWEVTKYPVDHAWDAIVDVVQDHQKANDIYNLYLSMKPGYKSDDDAIWDAVLESTKSRKDATNVMNTFIWKTSKGRGKKATAVVLSEKEFQWLWTAGESKWGTTTRGRGLGFSNNKQPPVQSLMERGLLQYDPERKAYYVSLKARRLLAGRGVDIIHPSSKRLTQEEKLRARGVKEKS